MIIHYLYQDIFNIFNYNFKLIFFYDKTIKLI